MEDQFQDPLANICSSAAAEPVHPMCNPPRHIHRNCIPQLLVAHAVLRVVDRSPAVRKAVHALAFDGRQLADNGHGRLLTALQRDFPRLDNERFRAAAEVAAVGAEGSDSLSVIRELTWSEASNSAGSFLPRFAARKRIPFAAIGESQYFGGTSDSSTADNEHSLAPLGYIEELAVQKSPADLRTRPAFAHFTEECCEVVPSIAREQSVDILDKGELGLEPADDAHRFEEEPRALALEAFAVPRDREVLAGEPAADDFDFAMLLQQLLLAHLGDVTVDLRVREPLAQNGLRLSVPLHAPRHFEPLVLEGLVEAADAGEQRADSRAARLSPAA